MSINDADLHLIQDIEQAIKHYTDIYDKFCEKHEDEIHLLVKCNYKDGCGRFIVTTTPWLRNKAFDLLPIYYRILINPGSFTNEDAKTVSKLVYMAPYFNELNILQSWLKYFQNVISKYENNLKSSKRDKNNELKKKTLIQKLLGK